MVSQLFLNFDLLKNIKYLCILGPLFIVVEFAPYGNLRQFLRDRRPSEYQQSRPSSCGPSLIIRDFVSFAFQIAKGMEYLGTRKVCYVCIRRLL